MVRAAIAEARVFESWQDYQTALKRAVVLLSDAQLRRRPIPALRTPGEIAEHIIFGRALHLCRALGQDVSELAPLLTWDEAGDPPRSAAEIVHGLDLTWRFITDILMQGSPTGPIPESDGQPITQIIWGLLDHDLPHAGELSLLLGAAGLPGVEI